jgi:vacuolar-type H+-ATPase subunit H
MELIKKIKDAEKQSSEIINAAKAGAAKQAEEFRKVKTGKLEQAQSARKKAIDQAIIAAETEGKKKVEKLHSEAKQQREHLKESVSPKIPPAVNKIMEHLSGYGSDLRRDKKG